MQKIKVTYIISAIDKAIAFEWIAERIDKSKFELSFVLLNLKPSYLAQYLRKKRIPVKEFFFSSKKDFPRLLWQVYNLLRKSKPDVVHTHLIEANLIGLIASKLLGIDKRIYTRHDANNRKKYHKRAGWLDDLSNKLASNIVAISDSVRNILINEDRVPPEKVHVIYHGFDLIRFSNVNKEEIRNLKEKYNKSRRRPVVGVIARYLGWKGVQYIIPAFKKLLKQYPTALLILANAKKGDAIVQIEGLLQSLPKESYCEIEFEHNLFALYQLFDMFVHVPINKDIEAFGQIYVEALAAGIPSIFTKSGIAKEFIQHEQNALVVDFQNQKEIYYSMNRILEDSELRNILINNGKRSIQKQFSLEVMINSLEQLYLS